MIREEPQLRLRQVQRIAPLVQQKLRRQRPQQLQLPQQPPPVPQAQVLKFGVVAALGAVIGSLARLQVSYLIQTPSQTSFPWSTFSVNVIGALLIGLVASSSKIMSNETRRHFVVTGMLGGFTSFSAIAVDTLNLSSTPEISALYVVATFAVGVAATHMGSKLGNQR
jgi:fluoride exporter